MAILKPHTDTMDHTITQSLHHGADAIGQLTMNVIAVIIIMTPEHHTAIVPADVVIV